MKPLKWLFWTFLFLVMLVAVDQFFLQVPPLHPAHAAVSRFYQDFRGRLLFMLGGEDAVRQPTATRQPEDAGSTTPSPDSIEAVIDQQPATPAPEEENAPRYLYSDAEGQLQFADSLEEIPPRYRRDAQQLAD